MKEEERLKDVRNVKEDDLDDDEFDCDHSNTSPEYPYTRFEECRWSPRQAAERMAALAENWKNVDNSKKVDDDQIGFDHLKHGWTQDQVERLRKLYGNNKIKNRTAEDDDDDDDDDDEEEDGDGDSNKDKQKSSCLPPYVLPILFGLCDQIKEPLILMLLGSAAVSLLLGNRADAISIAVALLIVGLVAAIQEYRSEKALEKLAHLVPPTCTCVRQQQQQQQRSHRLPAGSESAAAAAVAASTPQKMLARELVVGDIILLSTGEYVKHKKLSDKHISLSFALPVCCLTQCIFCFLPRH